jgi:hypothetical protein
LTEALIKHVLADLQNSAIWECAAGDGRLAAALRAVGYTVFASDIAPRGENVEHRDFLGNNPPRPGLIAATNPPFNQINQFIARGLQLLDSGLIVGLVLLVRSDALTAATRADAFNRAAGALICCWRPLWIEGSPGNGRWANAWVWWSRNHRGPPTARFLPPTWRQALLPINELVGAAA